MEYNVNSMYEQSNGFYDQTQKTKDGEEKSKLAMKASEGSISMSNNDTPPSPVSWPYPGGTGNTPPTGDPDGD